MTQGNLSWHCQTDVSILLVSVFFGIWRTSTAPSEDSVAEKSTGGSELGRHLSLLHSFAFAPSKLR